MASKSYNDQVFINCPFDKEYLELYRACIFVILDSGFIPRCSREINNGTQSRLDSIVEIVRGCRYGIHDISRVEVSVDSGLPRFNMPFELGVFYSAKHFGDVTQEKKSFLVLEKEEYRYQKFISDISGIDVSPHGNNPKNLIIKVQQWLRTSSRRTTIPAGELINTRFELFQTQIKAACVKVAIDYDEMAFIDLVKNMTDWLLLNQATHAPLFEGTV